MMLRICCLRNMRYSEDFLDTLVRFLDDDEDIPNAGADAITSY